ncbi:unnamed protein product, partial [Tenebrio molitor]
MNLHHVSQYKTVLIDTELPHNMFAAVLISQVYVC